MLDILKISVQMYLPELICVGLMCLLLVAEAMHKDEGTDRSKIYILATAGLLATACALMMNLHIKPTLGFYNAVVIDQFSTLIKLILVFGTLGSLWLSKSSNDIYSDLKSEFVVLAIGTLIGGMLLASANNMLTVYLGIEILSILSYVMTSLKREDSTSTEAGMKYALYGGLTAGIMLFGMSHIYGLLGSIQFTELAPKIASVQGTDLVFLMAAFLLFFAGLGYKISAFPFHMWSPDVYQGAPIPVTAFFAIVPKMAGIAVLIRFSNLFFSVSSPLSTVWIGLLHIVAALTMTVGNVTAIGQDSVKRLLAFSSIGHVGMMILGIVVLDEVGTRAILYYGMAYLFMTLVAFWITSVLNDTYGTDSQAIFRGLIHRHPSMAIMMTVVLFSLAGMPPFSGFVAKFNILSVVIEKKYYGLAFIAAINSVIGLYYYMKLIKEMVFSKPESTEMVPGFTDGTRVLVVALTLPVLFMGIFWEGLMSLSGGAKLFIQ
ncbi:MAG: NADH-quinone oxidoreductase subunit N [Bacteriovoracaceae bacterium]|nr:NADH-quinone oxidoreductase subunit N [Bacteriovoracaceae bacterium]